MAAKKKASGSSSSSTAAPTTTQVRRATADPVAPVEENPKQRESTVEDTSNRDRPGIDPSLSSDNANSSYQEVNDRFPADTGNQVEEIPGKPSPAKD